MPKVYYYTDQEVGIPWPGPDADRVELCKRQGIPHPRFTWYGWPGFEETTDPNQADVFVVRQRLYGITNEIIVNLPYYQGDRRYRHVFFGLGPDGPKAFRDLSQFPGIFFRACVNRTMLELDPDIIAWPWPVQGVGEHAPLPPGGFEYDVVFQGHAAGISEPVISSVERSNLKAHIVRVPGFWPSVRSKNIEEGERLRESFLRTMQVSRIAICPNSNKLGSIRYRLYEAMSMGRVNLFIGDKCVLPLSDKITWQDCIIRMAEQDVHKTGEILECWLSEHNDADIIAMGACAREAWTTWLKRENWGKVAGMLVKEKLGV